MKEWMQSNWKKVIGILVIAVATPNIIGGLLNIPAGQFTIGDENAWVSFYGSYTGGIIGGIVALIIASTQLINERKKNKESQRSFLSAALISVDYPEKIEVPRRNKGRIILTEAYDKLNSQDCKINYYSIVRYGGPDVIMNCEFTIIIGNNSSFEKTEKISTWMDFFEKDEEIFVPLCTMEFNKMRTPYVKEIQVEYETLAGEKMKFYQSEQEKKRGHVLVTANGETEINNHQIKYAAFKLK
ncbi:hypothetical protein OCE25_11485 [Bacillus cereus]|uniref:hypothetical protein n=1 Tax=Bacillus cereus group TaxID=86661 RepID=UPI002078CCCD|nr:hypothetical protein [Bacillus mycoides]MCU4712934.1 hypothetical protein [Bacillus cereus]